MRVSFNKCPKNTEVPDVGFVFLLRVENKSKESLMYSVKARNRQNYFYEKNEYNFRTIVSL